MQPFQRPRPWLASSPAREAQQGDHQAAEPHGAAIHLGGAAGKCGGEVRRGSAAVDSGQAGSAFGQIAHAGHTALDLTHQHLVGDVHEQAVLQYPGQVVDLPLQTHRIGDATGEFHV